MSNRRSFLLRDAPAAAIGGFAALRGKFPLTANGGDIMPGTIFEMVNVRLQFGSQLNHLLDWIERRALPLFQKHHFGPMGFFTVEVGSTIPALLEIRTYSSMSEMETLWTRMSEDPEFSAAMAEHESSEPAFYREDTALLVGTPFSPPLKPFSPGDPAHKIFELRIYESPTYRQLGYLHDRFAGGEIDLFHKAGFHPVFYADTRIGPNMPNMVYLIPFESEAHREKAWAAFRENPDWQKLRDDSVRRGGEIVRNITNMILIPTGFSALR